MAGQGVATSAPEEAGDRVEGPVAKTDQEVGMLAVTKTAAPAERRVAPAEGRVAPAMEERSSVRHHEKTLFKRRVYFLLDGMKGGSW